MALALAAPELSQGSVLGVHEVLELKHLRCHLGAHSDVLPTRQAWKRPSFHDRVGVQPWPCRTCPFIKKPSLRIL
eukprot:8060796-Alexandrium_andersonii.AAC.1